MKKIEKNKRLKVIILVICIIVIIGIIIGANVIKVNIASGKYNSANSGSNNKNLISEYIKEGITLGGVTGTLKVLDTSDATAKPEDILYGKTAYVNGVKITGTKITKEMLKIGDYVQYTPDSAGAYNLASTTSGYNYNQTITQETFNWRIMSINSDGTVDLVSDEPTDQTIYLQGALAYNNAVWTLNDICEKQYSNTTLGVTARSLNLIDIESKFNETGIEARNKYKSTGNIQYGSINTYTGTKTYYPNLYAKEKGSGINSYTARQDGIDASDSYYEEPTQETSTKASYLTATQSLYRFTAGTDDYFDSVKFYNLIFNSGKYCLLATRMIDCSSTGNVNYIIGLIWSRYLTPISLYFSDGTSNSDDFSIRPVVTLGSNIKFSDGDGTIDNPYKLSK